MTSKTGLRASRVSKILSDSGLNRSKKAARGGYSRGFKVTQVTAELVEISFESGGLLMSELKRDRIRTEDRAAAANILLDKYSVSNGPYITLLVGVAK